MTNFKLEKMYDAMLPGWWQLDEPPEHTYRIYAADNTMRHGRLTLAGAPFVCRLCNESDGWQAENEHVFVCAHEAIDALLPIARKDTMPTKLVGRVEEVE